jgi:glutamine---fructose-6-phosphate transaminase (isomerizing)
MCGIVGYTGSQPALPILLGGLRDLEYRGYDSAGVALAEADGTISVVKRAGKLAELESVISGQDFESCHTGIGHTRWATHGKPTDVNAHPHSGANKTVSVVHNGIVENYAELREELRSRGRVFESETDTETIAHLMSEAMERGAGLADALRETAARLHGSQAIVAMSPLEPGVVVATRLGNAGGVVIGLGDGENFVASDLTAVLPHTQRVVFLADREFAKVTAGSLDVTDPEGRVLPVSERRIPIDPMSALKGEYAHFMLKEIMEQPTALSDTIQSLVTVEPPDVRLDDLGEAAAKLGDIQRVVLLGMGTSLHAAMIGRQYIERFAGVAAEADNASEFRYRDPVLDEHTLVVSISQSGETVDVLEAMAIAKQAGCLLVTICNTEGAQTTRVADGTVYTRAGLERGVASTKCFTAAVAALYCLALKLGKARGVVDDVDLRTRIEALVSLPELAAGLLAKERAYDKPARELAQAQHVLFLGRGLAFPVAMEGALKLKEVSYIHAEGYAAGEMKHGPIALIDPGFPSVVLATRGGLRSKIVSNIEQLQARGGKVLAVITEGDGEVERLADLTISIPASDEALEPILASIPLQLVAYKVANVRGCDVDQPRNLAKTVTVE